MPDEDELGEDGLESLANEAVLVDALMGWDGDPCDCFCRCERFRDSEDDGLCPECRRGEHWTAP